MNQTMLPEILAVMPAATDPELGLFDSLCTIEVPSGNLGPSGAPDGLFVAYAGLTAIPCMQSVPSTARVQATEVKDLEEIMAKGLRHVLMNGFYPQLQVLKQDGQVRALLTDSAGNVNEFEILGVEPDSQSTQTRFECQLVTT